MEEMLLIKNNLNELEVKNSREEELKKILKDSFQRLSMAVDLRSLSDYQDLLHPKTMDELVLHIHNLQFRIIAEYARFTPIKDELKLA